MEKVPETTDDETDAISVRAEAWRGAKMAAKWSLLIVGGCTILIWIVLFVWFAYHAWRAGLNRVLEAAGGSLKVLQMVGGTFVTVALTTVYCAIAIGFIFGLVAWIKKRKLES